MDILSEMQKTLIELGLSNPDSFIDYFPKVRDRSDISVLKMY